LLLSSKLKFELLQATLVEGWLCFATIVFYPTVISAVERGRLPQSPRRPLQDENTSPKLVAAAKRRQTEPSPKKRKATPAKTPRSPERSAFQAAVKTDNPAPLPRFTTPRKDADEMDEL